MNLKKINEIFKQGCGKINHLQNDYAVLVPLIKSQDGLNLLFQIRSETLKRQPGEICFPGGKIEFGETPQKTAVREIYEEMGIRKRSVRILGLLDRIISMSMEVIYPYVGFINISKLDKIKFNEEVSGVFSVPVEYFIKNKPKEYALTYNADEKELSYVEEEFNYLNKFADKIQYKVYSYDYENYRIWGITARIIYNLVQQMLKTFSAIEQKQGRVTKK